MDVVVGIGFAIAAFAIFVSTQLYRFAYAHPHLATYAPECKKQGIRLIASMIILILAIIAWGVTGLPYAPMSGTPLALVMIASMITVGSIAAGLVLGVKRGQKRPMQS